MTVNFRVYAACLASHDNGVDHGRWIDCGMGADHIHEEIEAMLRDSPHPTAQVDCRDCGALGATLEEGAGEDGEAAEVLCAVCDGEGSVPSAEEYAFHDFEGFPDSLSGENESIDALAAFAEAVNTLRTDAEKEAFGYWYDDFSHSGQPRWLMVEAFREDYMGTFKDTREWAEWHIEEYGFLDNRDKCIRSYFDYDAYAQDAMMNLSSYEGDLGLHVFHG